MGTKTKKTKKPPRKTTRPARAKIGKRSVAAPAVQGVPERSMRGEHQVENLLRELGELPKSPSRDVAIGVATWIIGDDSLGGFRGILASVLASNHAAPAVSVEPTHQIGGETHPAPAEEVDPLS